MKKFIPISETQIESTEQLLTNLDAKRRQLLLRYDIDPVDLSNFEHEIVRTCQGILADHWWKNTPEGLDYSVARLQPKAN